MELPPGVNGDAGVSTLGLPPVPQQLAAELVLPRCTDLERVWLRAMEFKISTETRVPKHCVFYVDNARIEDLRFVDHHSMLVRVGASSRRCHCDRLCLLDADSLNWRFSVRFAHVGSLRWS